MTTWKLFVLRSDKTPIKNCADCDRARPEHDREACACLTCHGFYAGTADPVSHREMMRLHPDGQWAVRTGQASGIVVLDAEGGGSPSGIEVLDGWESWSGGWPLAPTNRIALTPSGGVHRYYAWEPGIKSRNRVLPGIDIKSDGGYVVIPTERHLDRRWLLDGQPGPLAGEMLAWLRTARGRHSQQAGVAIGHSVGYDYHRFVREGCPGGMRDEFFNELIFRMRKSGMALQAIVMEARRQWKNCAQPPDATYYMPWHHVEYKIRRIWGTVEVDDVSEELRSWAEAQASGTPMKTGRVTMAPRGTA